MFNRILKIFLLISVLYTENSIAQHGYSIVTGGFILASPMLEDSYKTNGFWKGMHLRSNLFEFGFYTGTASKLEQPDFVGFNMYLGGNFPIWKIGFGHRKYGIRGYLIQPFISGSLGYMFMDGKGAFNATASPGISIQLPYFLVDFKIDMVMPFSKGLSGVGEVLFVPVVTPQLDALWDVMGPELKFDRHEEGVREHTSTRTTSHTNDYGSFSVTHEATTTTTTYTPYSYDVYVYEVGPHVSLGPRISYYYMEAGQQTLMFGITQSGRASNFGYDLIAETGRLGYKNGEIGCSRGMGRLSFNFLRHSIKGYTQFTRLMGGIGVGHTFFSKPDNDRKKPDDNQFANFFVSFEQGAIALSFEKNIFFYDTFERTNVFTISYMLPYERLFNRYKEMSSDE